MLSRRQVAAGLVGFAAANASVARAATYPTKPGRILVGAAAGASTDVGTRLLAHHLGETTGQNFIVENRTGAGMMIAADAVAASEPDGHTLFMGTGSYATGMALNPNLRNNPGRNLRPVTQLNRFPSAIGVVAGSDIRDLADLVAKAKAAPNTIAYASAGFAGQTHLAAELFQKEAGIRLVHVPYRGGGPAIQDVVTGRVPLIFVDIFSQLPHAKDGKLRILAVAGQQRTSIAPDVPTALEQGVRGFDVVAWLGLFAPRATPKATIDLVHDRILAVTRLETFRARMQENGAEIVASTPEEFDAFFAAELHRYRQIADAAGIRIE